MLEGAWPDVVSFGADQSLRVCLRPTKLPRSDVRATAVSPSFRQRRSGPASHRRSIARSCCPARLASAGAAAADRHCSAGVVEQPNPSQVRAQFHRRCPRRLETRPEPTNQRGARGRGFRTWSPGQRPAPRQSLPRHGSRLNPPGWNLAERNRPRVNRRVLRSARRYPASCRDRRLPHRRIRQSRLPLHHDVRVLPFARSPRGDLARAGPGREVVDAEPGPAQPLPRCTNPRGSGE